MSNIAWSADPAALILFALLYFFDTDGFFSAMITAAAIHEAGHIAAICCLGGKIRKISLMPYGLKIDYSGLFSRKENAFAAVAGPLWGILFGFSGIYFGTSFWRICGSASVFLSVFNLIPIYPLDGGRMLYELSEEKTAKRIYRAASAVLMIAGTASLLCFGNISLLIISWWLFVQSFIVR